jgi:hypothetical protein
MRYVAAGGQAWVKTGAADTAWSYVDPSAGAAPAYGGMYGYDLSGTKYFTGNANVWTKQGTGLWTATSPTSGCTSNTNGNVTLPARAGAWLVTYDFTYDSNGAGQYNCEFAVYVNSTVQNHTKSYLTGPQFTSSTYVDSRLSHSVSVVVEAAASDVISLWGVRYGSQYFPSRVFTAQFTVTELR